MKLRQLRYVVEVFRHGNHLSAAADFLNTSQPGVSKQIQQIGAMAVNDVAVLAVKNLAIAIAHDGGRYTAGVPAPRRVAPRERGAA